MDGTVVAPLDWDKIIDNVFNKRAPESVAAPDPDPVAAPAPEKRAKIVTFSETRAELEEDDYQVLLEKLLNWTSASSPPIDLIRKVLHLLDVNEQDYALEIELQRVLERVITYIRHNRELQHKIETEDRMIGSLIRNSKLAVSEAALEKLKADNVSAKSNARLKDRHEGINEFSRAGRLRLEAYQHLFYALQTQSKYLAKLVITVPKASDFLKKSIYTLFCCSAAPRESYLLVRLLKSALREEVNTKINKPSEIITGSPFVITLAVEFYRNNCATLFNHIRPLILEVVKDKKRNLSLDPVVVYKSWITEVETRTGKVTGLPYEVTAEEAMTHEPVKHLLEKHIDRIVLIAQKFVETICSSGFIEEMPYGIRYISRCLYEFVQKKFPEAKKKELLNVVGNVLLYRFICSCIVSPDGFGILMLGPHEKISFEARTNLGTVSKLLQTAATGMHFSFGSNISSSFYQSFSLSLFLQETHEKLIQFFRIACVVESPEDYFQVNEFSDETLIIPPQIKISLKEIFDLHHCLHKYRTEIAPSERDPFRRLLNDCGPPPRDVADLANAGRQELLANHSAVSLNEFDVVLTLSSKLESNLDRNSMVSKAALRVKQAIVELIKHRSDCKDLNEVFFRPVRPEERDAFEQKKRDANPELKKHSILFSHYGESVTSLIDFVKLNLKSVNATNFDQISRQIILDVSIRIQHREKRRNELETTRSTLVALKDKRDYCEDILACYAKYRKTCLENLEKGQDKRKTNVQTNQVVLSYTAAKLQEKGVLVSLADANPSQFKQIVFDMTPCDNGVVLIKVNFYRMKIDEVRLDFQDLLRLQYEGVAVFNISDKAKINVNLFIYLLNKKFYMKGKRV